MNKNKYSTSVFIIASLLAISSYFILFQNKSDDFKIKSKFIDSIFNSLSEKEKISLLIVNENINDTTFFFSKQFKYKKRTFSLEPTYVLTKSIDFKKLLTVDDTIFEKKYFEFISLKNDFNNCNLINFEIGELFNIQQFNDTIFFKKIIQIVHFAYKNLSNNRIITVPYLNFADSTQSKNYEQILNQFNQFIAYTIEDQQQIKQIESQKKQNLIIGTEKVFESYENFIISNADMLITNDSLATKKIIELYRINKNYKTKIDKKISKIIYYKLMLQANEEPKKLFLDFPIDDLNKYFELNLVKKSIVNIKNTKVSIPLSLTEKKQIIIVSKNNNYTEFENTLKHFAASNFQIQKINNINDIEKTLNTNGIRILILDSIELQQDEILTIKKYEKDSSILLINIGYLKNLQILKNFPNLMFSWQSDSLGQHYISEIIIGALPIEGILPLKGFDPIKSKAIKLGYDTPEALGLNSNKLEEIDSIVKWAITNNVFPGCQVLVAKNGQIIFDKSYGYIDYSHSSKVTQNTLYDIASITKVVATTLSVMYLYDKGLISLNDKFGKFFKNKTINYLLGKQARDTLVISKDTINILKNKNWRKEIGLSDTMWVNDTLLVLIDTLRYFLTKSDNIFNVAIKDLLTHTSGIQPALPILRYIRNIDKIAINIYADTNKQQTPLNWLARYYSYRYLKDSATVEVARNFYLYNKYADTLWEQTKALRVSSQKKYVYSDVNMILLKILIDSITKQSFNNFVQNTFYKPLGLQYITYKPLEKFSRNNIAPTENDKYWRQQLVWGTVHDPSAALLGGIAGNAGVFSNAYSLAVICQMLLNGGSYNGKQFISQQTVKFFTQKQNEHNRALGFDMWSEKQIAARLASPRTYGHTGFTGNCIWIDPDNNLVFVFLSNRVHPNVNNQLLNKYKIRQKIHQTIYNSLFYFD